MNIIPSHVTIKDPFAPKGEIIKCEVLSWNTEERTLFCIYTNGLIQFGRFKIHFNDVIEFTFPNCVNELV